MVFLSHCQLTGMMNFSTWHLRGGQKQVRDERLHYYTCFSVPLSCPLVLYNHIHVSWQPEVSVINSMHVTRTRQQFWTGCAYVVERSSPYFSTVKKIIDMFHPIQRMFNCFKALDGKASHVWLVITPCSKFRRVLKENIVVNISPLNW